MKHLPIAVLAAASLAALLAGCASVEPSSATRNAEAGPEFTAEEKAAMTTEEKVAVYNEQQDEADQLVCRRERPVGSRMLTTVCYTRAEIEQQQRDAQDQLRPAKGYNQGAGD